MALANEGGVFWVTERVTNLKKIGRIYNIVQHPTIAGPFLDERVRVDCNGELGFSQWAESPTQWESPSRWPYVSKFDDTQVDVRFLAAAAEPPVVTYVVEKELGWLTATSPSSGLLLGYIWDADVMPWIHHWRKEVGSRPFVRGLEFGTAGLHRPGQELVEQGKIFDRKLFRYIDAGETCSFSYLCFLVSIPEGVVGVESIGLEKGRIVVELAGVECGSVELGAGALPWERFVPED